MKSLMFAIGLFVMLLSGCVSTQPVSDYDHSIYLRDGHSSSGSSDTSSSE